MELFNEYKNRYFHLVLKILNLCKDGLSRDEILKKIEAEGYDEKLISKNFKTFEGMILNEYEEENLNLLKKDEEKYYSLLSKEDTIPIKIRFSEIEKTWLKGMITEEKVQALLGNDIINKLSSNLSNVHHGSNEVIEFTNKSIEDTEADFNRISKIIMTILEAIDEKRIILYTNIDRNGNEHKNKLAVPLRIEYSIKDDKFRASMYSIEDKRSIMVNLHNLQEIKITDESFNYKREEIIKSIKQNKFCEEPITLVLKDRRGAMERCFMSFSSFERNSKFIGEGTYEVDIYYYVFQEHEVISKIISLGPYVTVKGPERVREKIIEKIKRSYDYQ